MPIPMFLSRYNPCMLNPVPLEPVDYLVIGHVAHDLTPEDPRLGGTVAYSALTARALGLRVGILTASGPETSLEPLKDIRVISQNLRKAQHSKIFIQNTGAFNICAVRQRGSISARCRRSGGGLRSFIWVRSRTKWILCCRTIFLPRCLASLRRAGCASGIRKDRVSPALWQDSEPALKQAGAVVISREDVGGDDELIESMAQQTRVLAVTEGIRRLCPVLAW